MAVWFECIAGRPLCRVKFDFNLWPPFIGRPSLINTSDFWATAIFRSRFSFGEFMRVFLIDDFFLQSDSMCNFSKNVAVFLQNLREISHKHDKHKSTCYMLEIMYFFKSILIIKLVSYPLFSNIKYATFILIYYIKFYCSYFTLM